MEMHRIRQIGKGSYGEVFEAVVAYLYPYAERTVAVKSSPIEYSESLQKELRILRRFTGCNEIVHCYSGFTSIENGQEMYNLFLELAPLGTLRDLIRIDPGNCHRQVRFYARIIVQGLCCIHENGYVHCDLKPANILAFGGKMGNESIIKLKIADFGLAVEPGEVLQVGSAGFRGTPRYMSPESVESGEIGPKLDIWSLGCVVLEMITGGKDVWDGFQWEDTNEFKFGLSSLSVSPKIPNYVSADCQNFLKICFQRNPNDRWSATRLLTHPYLLITWDKNTRSFI